MSATHSCSVGGQRGPYDCLGAGAGAGAAGADRAVGWASAGMGDLGRAASGTGRGTMAAAESAAPGADGRSTGVCGASTMVARPTAMTIRWCCRRRRRGCWYKVVRSSGGSTSGASSAAAAAVRHAAEQYIRTVRPVTMTWRLRTSTGRPQRGQARIGVGVPVSSMGSMGIRTLGGRWGMGRHSQGRQIPGQCARVSYQAVLSYAMGQPSPETEKRR